MNRLIAVVAGFALSLTVAGCFAHETAAVDVAVKEWSCPQYDVALTSVTGDPTDPEARSYAFVACGHTGTVSCHTVQGVWTCSRPSEVLPNTASATVQSTALATSSVCTKDTDCKGDRICQQGQCTAPVVTAPAYPAYAPSPSPSTAAPALQF
jgi:hypothetical protein